MKKSHDLQDFYIQMWCQFLEFRTLNTVSSNVSVLFIAKIKLTPIKFVSIQKKDVTYLIDKKLCTPKVVY